MCQRMHWALKTASLAKLLIQPREEVTVVAGADLLLVGDLAEGALEALLLEVDGTVAVRQWQPDLTEPLLGAVREVSQLQAPHHTSH